VEIIPQVANPYIKFPVIRIDNWKPKYTAIIKNAIPTRKNKNANVIVFLIPTSYCDFSIISTKTLTSSPVRTVPVTK